MELVANVWPVFDADTGVVLRFFIRGYCMDAPDPVISATLRALAATDFRLAQVFPIPHRFSVTSPFGSLQGCVTLAGFHESQAAILATAFAEVEKTFAKLQAVSVATANGQPIGIGVVPSFPPEPYQLVTAILETTEGELIPQIRS
jgi:hypothetical protein